MRVAFCESCGAPLDAAWTEIVVICRYCAAPSLPGDPGAAVPLVHPDDGRPRVSVDGRTYLVESRLAEGESSAVFRGRWVVRLGELVVLKVQRALSDSDLLRREHATLSALHRASTGRERLASRLPAPIALGPLRDPHAGRGTDGPLTRSARDARLVAVHGWRSGFVHTLADIAHQHPAGVDPRVQVWIAKRVFEVLALVHGAGVCHNAIGPRHVLVHPRDHGAMLVGYSLATAVGERVPGVVSGLSLPAGFAAERRAHPRWDLAMTARAVLSLGSPPAEVGAALRAIADGAHDDAWQAREAVDQASLSALGRAQWSPLAMPGWT